MLSKKILFTALAFTYMTPAFALFCPTNFNQINMGDTLEKVKQQCGAPDTEKESKLEDNLTQEWIYYIQVQPGNQASIKTTIAFTDGKATNISANATSLVSTSICNGNTVSIGDTQESVKTACGKPSMINQSNSNANAGTATKVIEATYNGTQPPTVLMFENGFLKGKK